MNADANSPRSAESDRPAGFRGGLAVFSGPSGSGKTSVCHALLEDPRVSLSVSATTRSLRPNEKEGVHYHFLSEEEFVRQRDAGAFIGSSTSTTLSHS